MRNKREIFWRVGGALVLGIASLFIPKPDVRSTILYGFRTESASAQGQTVRCRQEFYDQNSSSNRTTINIGVGETARIDLFGGRDVKLYRCRSDGTVEEVVTPDNQNQAPISPAAPSAEPTRTRESDPTLNFVRDPKNPKFISPFEYELNYRGNLTLRGAADCFGQKFKQSFFPKLFKPKSYSSTSCLALVIN